MNESTRPNTDVTDAAGTNAAETDAAGTSAAETDAAGTGAAVTTTTEDGAEATSPTFDGSVVDNVRQFVKLLGKGEDAAVEDALVQLSESRRWLAPVALLVGAVLMLLQGLKFLFANWRLTLVQLLPAMWIWVAMLDFKVHLLHGRELNAVRGPVLLLPFLAVAAITAASFYLNAVFAFAISKPGTPEIRPAFVQARAHVAVIVSWGFGIGVALAMATTVITRWGRWPFAIALSIVIGVMMICYLAVPARLIGIKSTYSKSDKLKASAIGGALGAVVCSPPYLLGRLGILMLGIHYLFVVGIILIVIGVTLTAGATSAVKSIKMSAKLVAGHHDAPSPGGSAPAR